MNGKQWENCIKKSCEKRYIFCKKLADGTSSWNKNDNNVRFQKSNECDFIIFDGNKLLMLEAKCHKGKSLPINCIRKNQIIGLCDKSVYKNVVCGLLVLFSDLEEAYFINIQDFIKFQRTFNRKSIPIKWCKENCINVKINKKKTNYDISIQDILLN